MRYKDFKKVEATYYFIQSMKHGSAKPSQSKDKTKQELQGLDTISASDLNLPKEYLSIF